MAQMDENSTMSLITKTMENVGIPVRVAQTIATAYYSSVDKICDCNRFIDEYKNFKEIQNIIAKVELGADAVQQDKTIKKQFLELWSRIFNKEVGKDQCPDPNMVADLSNHFKDLKTKYGDDNLLQKKANEILTLRNKLAIFELVVTFAYTLVSINSYNTSSKLITQYKQQLLAFENDYITPIVTEMRSNTFRYENIKQLVKNGLVVLGILTAGIKDIKEITSTQFWSSLSSATSGLLNLWGTVSSIQSLGQYASSYIVNGQKVLAVFQGASATANLILTGLHGWNWIQLKDLYQDCRQKINQLERIQREYENTQIVE